MINGLYKSPATISQNFGHAGVTLPSGGSCTEASGRGNCDVGGGGRVDRSRDCRQLYCKNPKPPGEVDTLIIALLIPAGFAKYTLVEGGN